VRARQAPFEAQLAAIPDPAQRRQRLSQLRKQLLRQLIDEKLIEQEARRLKLEVQPEDIERAVQEVIRRNKLTPGELEEALRREGKSLEEYKREVLRPQLLRLRVLNIQVRSRIAVSDDELKALYQQNLRSLGVETKVQARHIFVVVAGDATEEQRAERRTLARSLARRVKDGEDFAALARQYSDDSVSRADGGKLGLVGRGSLPPGIEDVVFSMKKGEIRGPLRTSRGFHIVQVTGREESSARPYEEVREQLRNQLTAQKMEKATEAWLKDVRRKSYVDIKD
jgi:peptidyl-prolyl cis-trans isomerase SurA